MQCPHCATQHRVGKSQLTWEGKLFQCGSRDCDAQFLVAKQGKYEPLSNKKNTDDSDSETDSNSNTESDEESDDNPQHPVLCCLDSSSNNNDDDDDESATSAQSDPLQSSTQWSVVGDLDARLVLVPPKNPDNAKWFNLQLLEIDPSARRPGMDRYAILTSWGRSCDVASHEFLLRPASSSLAIAAKVFARKYQQRTKNEWCAPAFVVHPKKYLLLRLATQVSDPAANGSVQPVKAEVVPQNDSSPQPGDKTEDETEAAKTTGISPGSTNASVGNEGYHVEVASPNTSSSDNPQATAGVATTTETTRPAKEVAAKASRNLLEDVHALLAKYETFAMFYGRNEAVASTTLLFSRLLFTVQFYVPSTGTPVPKLLRWKWRKRR